MKRDIVYGRLRAHIGQFFDGHRLQEYAYTQGPAGRIPPDFRVVHAEPDPRTTLDTYLSLGSWESAPDGGIEFIVASTKPEMACVELLAMTSYYHRAEVLGVGHTFPLGHGWLGGTCEHFLVSLPYPFGPDLEICSLKPEAQVQFLWLLPITLAEKQFNREHGLEALEQRFDDVELEFWNASRSSVV